MQRQLQMEKKVNCFKFLYIILHFCSISSFLNFNPKMFNQYVKSLYIFICRLAEIKQMHKLYLIPSYI